MGGRRGGPGFDIYLGRGGVREGGSQHPGQVKGHKHTSLNAFLIPKTLPVTWTLG